jgi:phosphate transport system permease protein
MSETTKIVKRSLPKRYRRESIFRAVGLAAIIVGMAFVVILFANIIGKGYPAFLQSYIKLPVYFDEQVIDPSGDRDPEVIARADYQGLIKQSLRERFPGVSGRRDKLALYKLISQGAGFELQDMVLDNPDIIGTTQEIWLLADDEIDVFLKGNVTRLEQFELTGRPVVSAVSGEVEITTDGPAFAPVLERMQELFEREQKRALRELERAREKLDDLKQDLVQNRELLAEAERYDYPTRIDRLKEIIKNTQGQISDEEFIIKVLEERIAGYQKSLEGTSAAEVDIPSDAASYLLELQGGLVRITALGRNSARGTVLNTLDPTSDDQGLKLVILETPESERRVNDRTIGWVRQLQRQGVVDKKFNTIFFTHGDSREPEQSGIAGALAGSFFTLIVTLLLSFPIGVGAAIYLEEFAPKNRWTDLIEVNINNLAAVPSIVFGLLGLAVFINYFGLPRSAPVVGGLVLTLMTLPTIIIASRAALKSVPPSIREAALGMGASRMQAMFHHILPLALPGMLTGTIIGMAQALGETAPLLMIGMVAFIVDIPQGMFDNATVLPVQIYLWADSPERAFVERTSAAIMVLLGFLITMNALAVFLRKKFERKW